MTQPIFRVGDDRYASFFPDVEEREFRNIPSSTAAVVLHESQIAPECRPEPFGSLYVNVRGLAKIADMTGVKVVHCVSSEQQFFVRQEDESELVSDKEAGFAFNKDGDSLGLYYSPVQLMRMARELAAQRRKLGLQFEAQHPLMWATVSRKGVELALQEGWHLLNTPSSPRELRSFALKLRSITAVLFAHTEQ